MVGRGYEDRICRVNTHKGLNNYKALINYFTEMCSGSEAGSYLRLIDFVCHSTLGLRVIKKRRSHKGLTPNMVKLEKESSLLTTYRSEFTLSS